MSKTGTSVATEPNLRTLPMDQVYVEGAKIKAILQQQPVDPVAIKAKLTNTARLRRAKKAVELILKSYESHHDQYREEYGLLKATLLVMHGAEKWLS